MKVGILTMSTKNNYGCILQCLALQNTLTRLGHKVSVIRFSYSKQSSLFRKLFVYINLFNIAAFFNDLKAFYLQFMKKPTSRSSDFHACNNFMSTFINFTELVNEDNIASVANQFDAIVIGSDKIWTNWGRSKLTYLIEWEPEFNGIRISYAACSSNMKVPLLTRNKVRFYLNKFKAISVRDLTTYNLVKNASGREADIVVDPVLLYDFEEFLEQSNYSEKYIFAYILGRSIQGGHKRVVSEIQRVYGPLKVKAIAIPNQSTDIESFADDILCDSSPAEWLSMLARASFVYTDSYHGCLFCLKFKKNFLGYYSETHRATRLIDLKKRYFLDRQIISSVEEMFTKESVSRPINYSSINTAIEEYKLSSLEYLVNSLD